MSSFDQSRGFGQPSGIHRQESWNASEGWNSFGSPPEPAARHHVIPATSSSLGSTNGFQHFASTAATDLAAAADDDDARAALLPRRELDYSVIDDDDDSGRPGGFDMHDCSDDNNNNRWRLPELKKVSIHLGPQLEGSLLRKHHVWVVTCEQGGATERRYSDFVWLLDCLTRRYPFRLLPQLPPKSIQYQGHFIGQDEGFLDRRRRGLERCLNSLVNHPVVGKDAILSKFLNEPGDLAAFRKNADNVSLVEESSTLTLSAAQLASLPATLDRRLDAVRSHLPLEIDAWTKLSVTVDRVAHRRLNQANEWTKLAAAFDHAVELELEAEQAGHPSSRLEPRSSSLSSPRTSGSRESGGGSTTTMINHHGRTRPVREEFVVAAHDDGSTSEGLGWRPREMKTLEKELGILSHGIRELSYENESSSKRLLEGFVEDVKRHRELYLNLRDLFHRQSTLGVDHLDKLEKRLSSNTAKLELLQSTTPAPPTYALDFEKVSTVIEQDKRTIEQVKRRREFIRWCMWQEVNWVFRCTSLLRRNIKALVESELRFGNGISSVWSKLQDVGLGDDATS